jgi:hypothetical protein
MKKVITIITAIALLFVVCPAKGVENKDFYSSGQILPGEQWNTVRIFNDGTVVDMLGGQIDDLVTFNISTFNMFGGEISKHNIPSIIDIGISSTLNVSGGMIDTEEFVLYGGSYTLISGGDITAKRLKVYYDATVDIRGGNCGWIVLTSWDSMNSPLLMYMGTTSPIPEKL